MIDLQQPNMQPENNIVKNLVYSGSKQNVKLTMVNGKILYEEQKFFYWIRTGRHYKESKSESSLNWKGKRYESNIIYRWCRTGNPDGPGGYGAVLQFVDAAGRLHEKELSAGYRKTTNNRMELMAAIVGLETLVKPCQVELYSDSKYLTDAFNQHWIQGWLKRGWKNQINRR